MNNGQEGTPFLPRGAGFTVTQRSLNLSLLSSDLAVNDLDFSSLVLSLRYSFDSAQYALFPYFHRVEPCSPSVSSTSSFGYDPDMPKPERGTPEYAAYKQAKKDRRTDQEREKGPLSGTDLNVSGGSGDEGNTRSLDKEEPGESSDRGFSAYAGVGYVSLGANAEGSYQPSYVDNSAGDFGISGQYSPVSPISSEEKPYVAPQYSKSKSELFVWFSDV